MDDTFTVDKFIYFFIGLIAALMCLVHTGFIGFVIFSCVMYYIEVNKDGR